MILNRLGNKKKLANKIISHFPPHKIFIEIFFGSGSIFFYKPKVKYNFLNDIDCEVYNLFRQVMERKDELASLIKSVLITEKQFKEWAWGKKEKTDLLNALRFLVLSNWSLYGKMNTLRIGTRDPKKLILDKMDKTYDYLKDVYFMNTDFRNVFKKIEYKSNIDKCFCYCDPPYLYTKDNYSQGFKEQDSLDLFDMLQESGVKWAMSEFDQPFILDQAKKRKLNIIFVVERRTLEIRRNEILITNYCTNTLFDGIENE